MGRYDGISLLGIDEEEEEERLTLTSGSPAAAPSAPPAAPPAFSSRYGAMSLEDAMVPERSVFEEEEAPTDPKVQTRTEYGLKSLDIDLRSFDAIFGGDMNVLIEEEGQFLRDRQLNPAEGDNLATEATLAAAEMAGPMSKSSMQGAGYAAAGLVAGQLGPQVLVPEEIVTTPLLFMFGSAQMWYRQGAGQMGRDMIKRGVDPNVAKVTALAAAAPYAALEFLQIRKILGPLGDKIMREAAQTVAVTVPRVLARAGWGLTKDIGQETLEEVAQEGVQIASDEAARVYSNAFADTDVDSETMQRIEEIPAMMKEMGPALAVLLLPGRGARTVGGYRQTKEFQASLDQLNKELDTKTPEQREQFIAILPEHVQEALSGRATDTRTKEIPESTGREQEPVPTVTRKSDKHGKRVEIAFPEGKKGTKEQQAQFKELKFRFQNGAWRAALEAENLTPELAGQRQQLVQLLEAPPIDEEVERFKADAATAAAGTEGAEATVEPGAEMLRRAMESRRERGIGVKTPTIQGDAPAQSEISPEPEPVETPVVEAKVEPQREKSPRPLDPETAQIRANLREGKPSMEGLEEEAATESITPEVTETPDADTERRAKRVGNTATLKEALSTAGQSPDEWMATNLIVPDKLGGIKDEDLTYALETLKKSKKPKLTIKTPGSTTFTPEERTTLTAKLDEFTESAKKPKADRIPNHEVERDVLALIRNNASPEALALLEERVKALPAVSFTKGQKKIVLADIIEKKAKVEQEPKAAAKPKTKRTPPKATGATASNIIKKHGGLSREEVERITNATGKIDDKKTRQALSRWRGGSRSGGTIEDSIADMLQDEQSAIVLRKAGISDFDSLSEAVRTGSMHDKHSFEVETETEEEAMQRGFVPQEFDPENATDEQIQDAFFESDGDDFTLFQSVQDDGSPLRAVAVRTSSGKVLEGQPGQIHVHMLNDALDDGKITEEEYESFFDVGEEEGRFGFTDRNGDYMNREETAQLVYGHESGIETDTRAESVRLRSENLLQQDMSEEGQEKQKTDDHNLRQWDAVQLLRQEEEAPLDQRIDENGDDLYQRATKLHTIEKKLLDMAGAVQIAEVEDGDLGFILTDGTITRRLASHYEDTSKALKGSGKVGDPVDELLNVGAIRVSPSQQEIALSLGAAVPTSIQMRMIAKIAQGRTIYISSESPPDFYGSFDTIGKLLKHYETAGETLYQRRQKADPNQTDMFAGTERKLPDTALSSEGKGLEGTGLFDAAGASARKEAQGDLFAEEAPAEELSLEDKIFESSKKREIFASVVAKEYGVEVAEVRKTIQKLRKDRKLYRSSDALKNGFGSTDAGWRFNPDYVEPGDTLFQKRLHPMEASTRLPMSPTRTEDPVEELLMSNYDAIKDDEVWIAHNAKLVEGYVGVAPMDESASPLDRVESFIEHVADNLMWLHEKVIPAGRKLYGKWYPGANKALFTVVAPKYSIEEHQAAGMAAVLSAQQEWGNNTSMLRRVLDTVTQEQDTAYSPEMAAWIKGYLAQVEGTVWYPSPAKRTAYLAANKTGADGKLLVKRGLTGNALKAAQKQVFLNMSKEELLENNLVSQRAINNLAGKVQLASEVAGKSFAQQESQLHKAFWLRIHDEAHRDKVKTLITPDGQFIEDEPGGEPTRWAPIETIAKAISIYEDGSLENVTIQLGLQHKVRNFYNNLLSPKSRKHITIDTHAVAAALLKALGSSAIEVDQNFGGTGSKSTSMFTGVGGTYVLYLEGYLRAAERLGITRENALQSITWEAGRALFTPTQKSDKRLAATIAAVWARHDSGELTIDEARDEVFFIAASDQERLYNQGIAKGGKHADNARDQAETFLRTFGPGEGVSNAAVHDSEGASPYEGHLRGAGVRRGRDGTGGSDGGAAAGRAGGADVGETLYQIKDRTIKVGGLWFSPQDIIDGKHIRDREEMGAPALTPEQEAEIQRQMSDQGDTLNQRREPGYQPNPGQRALSQRIDKLRNRPRLSQPQIEELRRLEAMQREAPTTLHQKLNGEIFFSQILKTVEEKMGKKASAEQAMGLFRKRNKKDPSKWDYQPGIKADEFEHLDLETFLEDKKTITKEELVTWIETHQVVLEESVYGHHEGYGSDARFQEYTTPGGTDYQERVLQWKVMGVEKVGWVEVRQAGGPPTAGVAVPEGSHRFYLVDDMGNWDQAANSFDTREDAEQYLTKTVYEVISNRTNLTVGRFQTEEEADAWVAKQRDESGFPVSTHWVKASYNKEVRKTLYDDGHFEDPNVLVFTRYKSRVGADGKKELAIEENQSDWHQKGRKSGYANDRDRAAAKEDYDTINAIPEGDRTDAQWKIFHKAKHIYLGGGGVADAPFKKTWHELSFKRMLAWAVEESYGRITWTTGETQNKRYDLSKVLQSIQYAPNEIEEWDDARGKQRTYSVMAFDKEGEDVISDIAMTIDTVEETFGKDIAEKFESHTGDEMPLSTDEDWRELKQDNLEVGGDGMKGFYDQMMPAFAKKYGKKYGATVGTVETLVPDEKSKKTWVPTLEQQPDHTGVWELIGQMDHSDKIYKELQAIAHEMEPTEAGIHTDAREGISFGEAMEMHGSLATAELFELEGHLEYESFSTVTMHSMEITPELKAHIQKGQALFQDAVGADGEILGQVTKFKDKPSEITVFKGAQADTIPHEVSHVFFEQDEGVFRYLTPEEGRRVTDWLGLAEGTMLQRPEQERLADAVVDMLFKEGALTSEGSAIRRILLKFAQWIQRAIGQPNIKAEFQRTIENLYGGAESVADLRSQFMGAEGAMQARQAFMNAVSTQEVEDILAVAGEILPEATVAALMGVAESKANAILAEEERHYEEVQKAYEDHPPQLKRPTHDSQGRPIRKKLQVLSLFDQSGEWAQPYLDAGDDVITVDIKEGASLQMSIHDFFESTKDSEGEDLHQTFIESLTEMYGDGFDVILAACPCTDFSVSGAQYWKAKDTDGRTAEAVDLVNATLGIIEYLKPQVWAIENPVGRLNKLVPDLEKYGPHYVQPFWFGDAYSKKTGLWGRFSKSLPRNEVAPIKGKHGSWLMSLGGKSERTKELRSVTPQGMSRAFFAANSLIPQPGGEMADGTEYTGEYGEDSQYYADGYYGLAYNGDETMGPVDADWEDNQADMTFIEEADEWFDEKSAKEPLEWQGGRFKNPPEPPVDTKKNAKDAPAAIKAALRNLKPVWFANRPVTMAEMTKWVESQIGAKGKNWSLTKKGIRLNGGQVASITQVARNAYAVLNALEPDAYAAVHGPEAATPVAVEDVPEGENPIEAAIEGRNRQTAVPPEKVVEDLFEKPGFFLPDELHRETAQRYIQDSMNRIKKAQKIIGEHVQGHLPEEVDVYLAAELMIGQATQKIDESRKELLHNDDSFIHRLTEAGYDPVEFGDFMYAQHAPERNAHVREKINEELEQYRAIATPTKTQQAHLERLEELNIKGSGMTDEEAAEIAALHQGTPIEEFAREYRKTVTKKALDVRLETGLIDQETYDRLEEAYQFYVPLKGLEGEEGSKQNTGGGVAHVPGADIRHAKGRLSKASNPMTQGMIDLEEAIVRGEKNKVGNTLVRLVYQNPNEDVWTAKPAKHLPVFDSLGEIAYVRQVIEDSQSILDVKVDGKTVYVEILDEPMARGLRGLGGGKGGFGIEALQKANGYLRAVSTTYNPEFLITNFERDLQMALGNLTAEHGFDLANQVANDVVPWRGAKAGVGIWKEIRKGEGEWADYYTKFKKAGGKIGWLDQQSLEDKTDHLTKEIDKARKNGTVRKTWKAAGDLVEDMNEAVESGVRLASFRRLIEAGVSEKRAAQIAKNLTVNFNKKGEWGAHINALWLFSNASIQGTAKMIVGLGNPLKKPTRGQKRLRKIVGGMMATSFASSMLNRYISQIISDGDDEDPWEDIAPWVKDNYHLQLLPNGKVLGIKVPYGWNIFHVIGRVGEEVAFGSTTKAEGMSRIINAFNDAFNPLGGGSLAQFAMPTILDLPIQIALNENFAGAPIQKEQSKFGPHVLESERYFISVREPTKAFTTWLNKTTGGGDITAGAPLGVQGLGDISPEVIDHILDFATGGVGKFGANTFTTAWSLSEGDFPNINNIPIFRQFMKEPNEWTPKRLAQQILEDSGTQVFPIEQQDRFLAALRRAERGGALTTEDREEYTKQFIGNQLKAKWDYIAHHGIMLEASDEVRRYEYVKLEAGMRHYAKVRGSREKIQQLKRRMRDLFPSGSPYAGLTKEERDSFIGYRTAFQRNFKKNPESLP